MSFQAIMPEKLVNQNLKTQKSKTECGETSGGQFSPGDSADLVFSKIKCRAVVITDHMRNSRELCMQL